jgi:DNA-binding transcriptional LysR family regulator
VSLLENNQPPNTAVWAIYPQRRYPLPKVRLLIETLRDGLSQLPEYAGRASRQG